MSNTGCKYLTVCLLLIFSASVAAEEIHGAGATFPALLYQKWAMHYSERKGVKVDYLAGYGKIISVIFQK